MACHSERQLPLIITAQELPMTEDMERRALRVELLSQV